MLLYVGITIQPLNNRVSGHRRKFRESLNYNGDRLDLDCDDDDALGLHLYFQHAVRDKGSFDGSFPSSFWRVVIHKTST